MEKECTWIKVQGSSGTQEYDKKEGVVCIYITLV